MSDIVNLLGWADVRKGVEALDVLETLTNSDNEGAWERPPSIEQ